MGKRDAIIKKLKTVVDNPEKLQKNRLVGKNPKEAKNLLNKI